VEPYQAYTKHIKQKSGDAETAAFFDLDGTIIATHSVKDMFSERLFTGQVSLSEAIDLVNMAGRYALKMGSFEDAMASSLRNVRGLKEQDFKALGEKVFRERLTAVVFPEMKAIIRAHRASGHTQVIVTSATRFQAEGLARSLGIDHILCTELAVSKGRFTGKFDGEACYGPAKLTAARRFAQEHGLELEQSYFYSNGSEDLPLLKSVAYPVAINPDKKLLAEAKKNDWLVHQLESRGSTGIWDVARTVTTFASVLPSMAIGLPFRWLANAEREATNFSISAWSQFASLVAGMKLIVEGEERLWTHRPAVFLFNHQSAMDLLITARLLQKDFTGIAKKEIQRQPLMGPAMIAAGVVFIDRESGKNPKDVLKPAVEALQGGRSVLVAPEGTRSRDETLGEFKKGAFHLAMQAGVPIVPIVIHNAVDALPNKSMIVRPAEIKVTVLEPIATEGWNLRSVVRATRQVRESYLETLQQTPSPRQ
jgi:putative phosphoserine phosphatase/1-acylglycerol-3-phosphate O-acyltransferase